MDSVEGEIFVVDGVEGPAQHSGLHLVLLLWQQLQLHVRVAAWINQLQCNDTQHGHIPAAILSSCTSAHP